jgi:hypothetical protein
MVILYHPMYMICIGLFLLVLFILLAIFIVKYFKSKQKKYLVLSAVFVVIIILSTVAQVLISQDYQYLIHYDRLEYNVTLKTISGDNETVVIPISENYELMNRVSVSSGEGQISIIETENGMGLIVNFTSQITIYGEYETTTGIGEHDLTMVNNSIDWRINECWIQFTPTNIAKNNCSLKLELVHEALDWWEVISYDGFLNNGWNVYEFEHWALS